jgi:hypothetical protein
MKSHLGFLLVLGLAATGLNAGFAAPTTVGIAPTPAINVNLTTSVNSSVSTFLPPAGGQISPGGVGGQAVTSTRPGGQLMPGASPGGQLAPGQIPGGSASGLIPALPVFNPFFRQTNFAQPFTPNPAVIVTGNSSTATAPGGTISGNGVGGNSRVIVTGRKTTVAPGGAISGNGVGGSRVIVTGNGVTTPGQSGVIVTGNALTGAGVGGTNAVPVLR